MISPEIYYYKKVITFCLTREEYRCKIGLKIIRDNTSEDRSEKKKQKSFNNRTKMGEWIIIFFI